MSVRRLDPVFDMSPDPAMAKGFVTMTEWEGGSYVRFTDYDAQASQLAAAHARITRMQEALREFAKAMVNTAGLAEHIARYGGVL